MIKNCIDHGYTDEAHLTQREQWRLKILSNMRHAFHTSPPKKSLNLQQQVQEIRASQLMPRQCDGAIERFWLIKWKGYDESENTWEPKESIGHLELFEEFEKNRKRNERRNPRFDSASSDSEGSYSPQSITQTKMVLSTNNHRNSKKESKSATQSASNSKRKQKQPKLKKKKKRIIKLKLNKKRNLIEDSDDSSDVPIMTQPLNMHKKQKKKAIDLKTKHSLRPTNKSKSIQPQKKQKCNQPNISFSQKPKSDFVKIPKTKPKRSRTD